MTYEPTPPPVESPPTQAEPSPSEGSQATTGVEASKRSIPLLPIVVGVLVGLVILAVVLAIAMRSLFRTEEMTGIPLEVTRVSVSPIQPPPPPSSSAPVVAEFGDTQLALPAPVVLEVAGRTFSVQTVSPDETERWETNEDSALVVWVDGTVINYLFGLPSLPESQEILEELQPDDPIIVRLSNGTRLTFRVASHDTRAPEELTPFIQASPGLTLLYPREETPWNGVTADFEAAVEPTPPAGGVVAQVGQAVQVGDARVTVRQGQVETGRGDPGPGTMIYGVEFLVENSGSSPLMPGDYLMLLLDSLGNRYLPSSAAMEGLLSSPVPPGESAEGVALYVVPEMLAGPDVTWVFSPAANSELRARFAIPYSPDTGVSSASAYEVDVYDAFVSEDGQVLHILADIYNDSDIALTVMEEDVILSSSAGQMGLTMTAPQLPWTVPADDFREVEMMFERPDASSAVLTILGYTFEISGLR